MLVILGRIEYDIFYGERVIRCFFDKYKLHNKEEIWKLPPLLQKKEKYYHDCFRSMRYVAYVCIFKECEERKKREKKNMTYFFKFQRVYILARNRLYRIKYCGGYRLSSPAGRVSDLQSWEAGSIPRGSDFFFFKKIVEKSRA